MPFTGTWATKARQAPAGHKVMTAQPVHSVTGDPTTADHWTAAPGVDWGDAGDPWAHFVTDTPGDWTETMPADEPGPGHDYSPGHNVDTGTRPNDGLTTFTLGERYTDDNHESPDDIPAVSPIVRGVNGRPENNPTEAPRAGQRVGRTWVDRQRNYPDRVTDGRVVYANLPTMGGDPGLDTVPDEPGPYSTPFDAWARGLNGGPRSPMLRRIPTSVSDSVTTDGLDDDDASDAQADASWVVG